MTCNKWQVNQSGLCKEYTPLLLRDFFKTLSQDPVNVLNLMNGNINKSSDALFNKLGEYTKDLARAGHLEETLFLYGKPNRTIITILSRIKKFYDLPIHNTLANELLPRIGAIKSSLPMERTKMAGELQKYIETDRKNKDAKFKALYFMLGILNYGDKIYVTISDEMNTEYNFKVLILELMLNALGYDMVYLDATTLVYPFRKLTNNTWNSQRQKGAPSIYYVHSTKYMNGLRFIPFKRFKSRSCNNGSSCTESKLFSYLGTDKIINDFVSYWVSHPDEDSLLPRYCFTGKTPEDKKVRANIMRLTKIRPTRFNSELVKGFALPCPGCQKNYSYYKGKPLNQRDEWDTENCESIPDQYKINNGKTRHHPKDQPFV